MKDVRLSDESQELLEWLAAETEISTIDILERIFSAHLHELWELRIFLHACQSNKQMHDQATNLLISYGGGESILRGIKRIDPNYVLAAEAFRDLCRPGREP